ncbi:MAG: right-handed parallel beta-helix repeat-containing protein [Nitrospira sp.]|nr:right-handed parallel beta-helix repeat-containing protein [Nitrospira sp.]MBS0166160.1 right-handed parallel beta-helix repeat-containing protein [Nitrospira sp.]
MINHLWKFSGYGQFWFSGISILFILLEAMTVHGATYYVSTTGNDSNPGTLNQPFKSFQKGVQPLQPGDSLYIRGGLYTEQIDLQTPNKTGTAGKYITIGGYQGETVILQFADTASLGYGPIKARGNRGYFIFEHMILDGSASSDTSRSGWAIRDGNHHFTLRNLEIKNFKNVSAVLVSANDVTIQNCKLHDQVSTLKTTGTYHYGIYFHDGANGLIEGTDIYNNAGGGLQIYPGPINTLVVRNNTIHDNNTKTTIHIGGIVIATDKVQTITDVRVYNNIIYNNGSSPSSGIAPGIRVGGVQTRIFNNTVYNNKGYGIVNNDRTAAIQNNIVFGNVQGDIYDLGPSSHIDHNLSTDPKFVKPETFDFRLQPNSPAIDGGYTVSDVVTDFRNMSRPIGTAYDVGAYEGDGSDVKPIQSPQDLAIQ